MVSAKRGAMRGNVVATKHKAIRKQTTVAPLCSSSSSSSPSSPSCSSSSWRPFQVWPFVSRYCCRQKPTIVCLFKWNTMMMMMICWVLFSLGSASESLSRHVWRPEIALMQNMKPVFINCIRFEFNFADTKMFGVAIGDEHSVVFVAIVGCYWIDAWEFQFGLHLPGAI